MNRTQPRAARRRPGIPGPLRLPAVLAAAVAVLLVLRALFPAPGPEPELEPVPIAPDWVEQALLPVNEWSRPGDKLEAVNGIVIHYTGNPGTTARQNRDYFAGLAQTHETYASSNFVVGLEGEALQCVPSDEIAFASSQRNADTLSIEVCHPDETGAFTPTTEDALLRLTQWLVDYYRLGRDQILRHYDVTGKECPRYYVQHPEAWEAFLDRLAFPK